MTYAATEQTQTYNGWKNRETWLAFLWLTNDQPSYSVLQEACTMDAPDWEKAEWLRDTLSYQLEDEIDEPCMWRDLLHHAFASVDWQEVIRGGSE